MPSEEQCLMPSSGSATRLLNAIEKVRLQKQRPSVERIHRVLRQLDPDLSMAAVNLELDKAAKDGIILKVVTNNLCSYKLLPSGSGKSQINSLPVLHVFPSQKFLDVIVSVVSDLKRCSLEALENQLQRKYALEISGDLNLRQELRDYCRKLVKLDQLRKDGIFFSLPPKGAAMQAADSVGDETIWKNATICLEDCTSNTAMSSMSSLLPAHDRLKQVPMQWESENDGFSLKSGDNCLENTGATAIDRLPSDDPYSFRSDSAVETPVKQKHKNHSSSAKPGLQAPSGCQVPWKPVSTQKSSGDLKSTRNFSKVGFARSPKTSKEMASCDSTTSNPVKGSAPSKIRPTETAALGALPVTSQPFSGDWEDSTTNADSLGEEEEAEKQSEEKPKKKKVPTATLR